MNTIMNTVSLQYGKEPQKSKTTRNVILVGIFLCFTAMMIYFLPSFFRAPLNPSKDVKIYYRGVETGEEALYKNDVLYLPLSFVSEYVDSAIRLDDQNQWIIITTKENLFHFPLGIREGLLNLEPYEFTYPALNANEKVYLPIDSLKDIYHLEINEIKEDYLVSIFDLKKPQQMGKIIENTKTRVRPGYNFAWINKMKVDEKVIVLREENGWYWIENGKGEMGYVNENNVELTSIKSKGTEEKVYQPWNPVGRPVVLTWEYVGQATANIANIANRADIEELTGVKVMSPTWFSLQKEGLVANKADKSYVDWAHSGGRQVWGLFSNSFDPKLTHEFLGDTKLRIKVIKQILSYVDLYELDGINLDFENMYFEDKEAYVNFVKELAPLLHEKERVLTVDVTFHSMSKTWSMCYDRAKLAEVADYLMVMGYDEHGAGSLSAGSVASLPWVEEGVVNILKEVSPEKIILGIPFYTRLWKEELGEDGDTIVTSEALTLKSAENWIIEKNATVLFDEKTGQNYVEVTENGEVYRMWLEDDLSME
ncbi:MAG: glycosyl hydrolase family 18 protein, partial [Clostridia bacterium]|nr:glycosyl hydrolase family 18 protein [Clostridia bacterium]